jgi:carnitine O-acetyltransferase
MYVGGRTETIRSCSQESLEFSRALSNADTWPQVKYETMKKAIEAHKSFVGQAVRGLAVDRHLLGLKLIAKENGIPIPEIFTEKGFVQSTHFRLSTSQVKGYE